MRRTSWLLAVIFVVGMLPLPASATHDPFATVGCEGTSYKPLVYSNEVRTKSKSVCSTTRQVVGVESRLYRSRWWGWQKITDDTDITELGKVAVAEDWVWCNGTTHQYRTLSFHWQENGGETTSVWTENILGSETAC